MRGLFFSVLLCLSALSGCGVSDDPTRVNDFTPLTGIEIQTQNPQVAVDTSNQFTAIGNFSGEFTRDITAEVTWSSLDEAVATISNAAPTQGRAKGLGAGVVTIVAQLGDISASLDFEVTDAAIATLTVAPAAADIVSGTTRSLSAAGTFSDGTSQTLTPDVTWSSSDSALITVSNAPGSEGLAEAVGTVSADTAVTITAAFPATAPVATATATLTVSPAVLQSISVTPASTTLETLSTRQYGATGLFSDGTSSDITDEVSWSAGDSAIATVDSAGLATTLRVGTTAIRATMDSVTGEGDLTVTGSSLDSITVSPQGPVANVGDTVQFTSLGTLADGTSADITELVTWSSSNMAIATISNDAGSEGEATAVSVGTSEITAALGSFSVPVTLAVSAP